MPARGVVIGKIDDRVDRPIGHSPEFHASLFVVMDLSVPFSTPVEEPQRPLASRLLSVLYVSE